MLEKQQLAVAEVCILETSTVFKLIQINLLLCRQHGGMVFTPRYRFGRCGIQIHGKWVPQNPVRFHVSISELYYFFLS